MKYVYGVAAPSDTRLMQCDMYEAEELANAAMQRCGLRAML